MGETVDLLENVTSALLAVPTELAEIKVCLPKHRKPRSRGEQRDIAVGILDACTKALTGIDNQAARDFRKALEDAASNADECVFPGWNG